MTYIKERIIELAKNKGISVEEIAKKIKMTYSSFKGNAKLTPLNSDAIANILTCYEDVNADWLLTGKGEMLKQDTKAKEGINLNNVGSGIIGNAGTMTMGNVQHYPNNVVNDGMVKDDKDQQIILLKEKVLHLEEMLKEKERVIQILLKNS